MTTSELMSADQQRQAALARRIESIDDEVERLRAEQRELRDTLLILAKQDRPTYPTDAQRHGVAEAARRFREGTQYKSHHGDPCGPEDAPYVVVATANNAGFTDISDAHWLRVRHSNPEHFRQDAMLWRFGDSDIEAFLSLLAEQGFEPVKHWPSDGGHSFVVREIQQ